VTTADPGGARAANGGMPGLAESTRTGGREASQGVDPLSRTASGPRAVLALERTMRFVAAT
jgi:hypothetical protein